VARSIQEHHKLSYSSDSPKYQIPDVMHSESTVAVEMHRNQESIKIPVKPVLDEDPEIIFDEEITVNMNARPKSQVDHRELTSEAVQLPDISKTAVSSPISSSMEETRRSIANLKIQDNWMMSFETPAKLQPGPGHSVQTTTIGSSAIKSSVPSQPDLLGDFSTHVVSPNSVARYTEKDLAAAVDSSKSQAEKELSVIQNNYYELESKYKESEASRLKMRDVVEQYEKAMNQMIGSFHKISSDYVMFFLDDSKQEKERSRIFTEKVAEEKERLKSELHSVENSFQELRARYEEVKNVNEQYRKVFIM
jgi:acyl carrier protein phosphodiesterase